MPSLVDIVNGPWAILPDRLIEIQGIYATHLRGEKINIPDVEAKLGRKLDNRHETFLIKDGVAIIPVDGAIAKRMNLFSQISGGVSTQMLQRDIEIALNDPKVKAIILNVDSPGGTVDGTAEVADFIFQNRGQKPVVAFSDGMICSAAYWIASAADSIHITGHTNNIGSIGVVASHRDYSGYEKALGFKTTEITAGKYKRISSQYEPLSDVGRADIQEKVDTLYSVFVDAVAKNRSVALETVLSDMADGRVFIGRQAIENGLVDGVSTLDDLIDMLAAGITPQKRTAGSRAEAAEGEPTMSEKNDSEKIETVTGQPDKSAQSETSAPQVVPGVDAATVERERILAIAGACLGEEAAGKFSTIINAGLTPEQISALGISVGITATLDVTADLENRKEILSALKEGNEPVGKVGTVDAESKNFNALVDDYRKEHGCSRTEAIKACATAHPEAHAAYIKQ